MEGSLGISALNGSKSDPTEEAVHENSALSRAPKVAPTRAQKGFKRCRN